jgi:iron complex transport system substrate-binding protein
MVGISAHTRLPDGVVLPVVASSGQVDIERLLKLKPDAVLGWTSGNSRAQIERLERLGLAVVVTEVHVPADIPRITRLVGLLAGTPGAAEEAARGLEREISSLGRAARERPTPVFVEIWHQPLMTVNGAHLISQLVSTCGGRNVFAGARALTPVISREALLVASPEVVIVGAAPGEKQSMTRWRDVAVPAARSGRVHAIDPHLLHGLGPGALVAARQICAAIGTSA